MDARASAAPVRMMSSEVVRPCPFCGSKAEIRYNAVDGTTYIVCTNPRCRCRSCSYTRHEVLRRWNNRYEKDEQ